MKMTITRALVELKHMQDKITRAIGSATFGAITVGADTNKKFYAVNQRSVELTKEKIDAMLKGSYDQVQALIAQRQKIKAAVILSNAATQVQVLGRSMTVAEAIELKALIPLKEAYLSKMRQEKHTALVLVQQNNDKLEAKIQELTMQALGAEKGAKLDQGMLDTIANSQNSRHLSAVLGAEKLSSEIEKVEKELAELQSELDFVLSESNAQTSIEIH